MNRGMQKGDVSVVIEVRNLVKSYDEEVAVDNISFSVREGEIFCISGPNGSGKTSTIECIEGLREIDSGEIRVLGLDPFKDRKRLYEQIGVQIQEHAFVSEARVDELCELYSSFYRNPVPYIDLLKEFDLYESRNIHAVNLSSGEKKKLSFVLTLLPRPKIVFLDEITSFLDPASRKDMLSYIKDLKNRGITTVYITHHIDEVELLGDRVCFIKDGKILKIDTPSNLIENSDLPEIITFESDDEKLKIELLEQIKYVYSVSKRDNKYIVRGKEGSLLRDVMNFLRDKDIDYSRFYDRPPNLEDVYLDLIKYRSKERGD